MPAKSSPLITKSGARNQLLSRGVPNGVMFSSGLDQATIQHLVSRIEVNPDTGIKVAVAPTKQLTYFDRTMDDPLNPNYFMCIAGQRSDTAALQLGLHIFARAIDSTPDGAQEKPYWHMLIGSPQDNLRDSDASTEVG